MMVEPPARVVALVLRVESRKKKMLICVRGRTARTVRSDPMVELLYGRCYQSAAKKKRLLGCFRRFFYHIINYTRYPVYFFFFSFYFILFSYLFIWSFALACSSFWERSWSKNIFIPGFPPANLVFNRA